MGFSQGSRDVETVLGYPGWAPNAVTGIPVKGRQREILRMEEERGPGAPRQGVEC